MRKVRLKENVVDTDRPHRFNQIPSLKPEACIEILPKIFGRGMQKISVYHDLFVLVVERFQQEGYPADTTLDRNKAEVGIAIENAAIDQVCHDAAVVEEKHGSAEAAALV